MYMRINKRSKDNRKGRHLQKINKYCIIVSKYNFRSILYFTNIMLSIMLQSREFIYVHVLHRQLCEHGIQCDQIHLEPSKLSYILTTKNNHVYLVI